MSSVLAKFRLTACEQRRSYDHPGTVEAEVTLQAVKSPPFGEFTPSGEMRMSIRNAAAAKVFVDAWQKYLCDTDPKAQFPEFYVRLTSAHEVDNGKAEA